MLAWFILCGHRQVSRLSPNIQDALTKHSINIGLARENSVYTHKKKQAIMGKITLGATVGHLRLRRTPTHQLETMHRDYDHSHDTSYIISYDENQGGVYNQTADGSLYNQTYDHRNREGKKQELTTKVGNVRETGPNATGKIQHYNVMKDDKLNSKEISKAGHKDIIDKPVYEKGPDGKLVIAKGKNIFHQQYNHTKGEESRNNKEKDIGKTVETLGGAVKHQQHSDNTLEDVSKKDYKQNVGEQILGDQEGNFSNTTYSQAGRKEMGKHVESKKGSLDDNTKRPKTTN